MNWTISQLDRTLPDGVVYTAHWRVTGRDGDFSGSVYGTQSFDAKDPSDPDFVAYENLTEATVIQWVKEAMGADTVAAHEAAVQAQIGFMRGNAAGVPW